MIDFRATKAVRIEAKTRLSRRALLGVALAPLAAPPVMARAFPSRPITLVVPFAAGGGVDATTRLVAEVAGEALGQRFVIENRGGGATVTGSAQVARAEPDGHTLLVAPTTMVINPAFRPNLPFDWRVDFAPVRMIAKLPFVVGVRAASPLRDMKSFEAAARAARDPFAFGSGGTGTVAHLAGELFALRTGARLQHIPYRGEGPALGDLLGGSLSVAFATLASVAGQVQSGAVRALGMTSGERSAALPDIPTIQEQGYADYDVSAWVALLAPRGTTADAIASLGAAFDAALATPALRDRLKTVGADPAGGGPAETSAFMAREALIWAEVVRAVGLRPD